MLFRSVIYDFPSAGADYTRTFRINHGADYISSGNLRLRIIHTSAGNPIHTLVIDQFQLGTDPAVHINEDITLTDSSTVVVSDPQLVASDNLTIADSSGLVIPINIGVQDDAVLADSATTAAPLLVSGQDNITAADSVLLVVSDPQLIVSDSVLVSEAATIVLPPQYLLDAIISDAAIYLVSISDAALYGVDLSDAALYGVSLSESTRS